MAPSTGSPGGGGVVEGGGGIGPEIATVLQKNTITNAKFLFKNNFIRRKNK